MKTTKLSKLKKGDFFKFAGEKKVYIFLGGGPVRGFEYTDFTDVNAFKRTKTNRAVDIDFTF